jgi:hypothetical protein
MKAGMVARTFSLNRQHWFVLALLLFFVGLSVQYGSKAFDGRSTSRSAFERWRNQILELDRGTDIYRSFNYPNPPIMALMLYPLAVLPPPLGALCWFYLKVGMALAAMVLVFRLVETPDRPFPPWAKALTLFLSLRPVMGDLSHGNINLFILFLVVAALYALRRGRDITAGVLLALGIACKVTPALFVPYFAWKRAWKTLAGCLAGLVLFFGLLPGCFLGMGHNARLLASWYDHMVRPFVVDGVVTTEHINQSLPGLVFRLTTHSPSTIKYVHDLPVGTEYHNLWDWDPGTARLIIKGAMALFAALVVWTCRTPLAVRGGWRLAAEYSLVVLGMLLFSERTWKHHCVTLVLSFAVISYYLAVCRPGKALRAYLIGTLTAVMVLMATTSTSLLADAKLAQAYGAYVWAYLLLVAALAVLLRTGENPGFGDSRIPVPA